MTERFTLAAGRIREISRLSAVDGRFRDYFERTASQIAAWLEEYDYLHSAERRTASPRILAQHNHALYEDILPEHYGQSYANPDYAKQQLGKEFGPLLAALVFECRAIIPFVYEDAAEEITIRMELFLEIETAFEVEKRQFEALKAEGKDPSERGITGVPAAQGIRKIFRDFLMDYAEAEDALEIADKLTVREGSASARILHERDLTDPRTLYDYGEFITGNELGAQELLAGLSNEEVDRLAMTFTEGYRTGFVKTGKHLELKSCVGLIWHAGFERVIRRAMERFADLGKTCSCFREVLTLFRTIGPDATGIAGADPNPQYRYDHREDLGLFLDDAMNDRRIEALDNAYRRQREETRQFAGPAVLESFGEEPFAPVSSGARVTLDSLQQKMMAQYRQKAVLFYNEAVIGSNRSFTIMDLPLPGIAASRDQYGEIFEAIVRINTLDLAKYREIQQILINALDTADKLEVKGANGNRTDLCVNLWKLNDPMKETIFENCVADVNIPVGEVFTSPVLHGTNGVLHVKRVFLEGLEYRDLCLTFRDGCVSDYSCGNFAGESGGAKRGRAYIEENILFHHRTLPMGECAIGTNTTAYAAGKRYGISGRLPILIAEKTGPHFAVGDTCYSHEEDNRAFNPDGKEIVAKDNDFSKKRGIDPQNAYFGCHTDITIPYEELGSIEAVRRDGSRVTLLRDGRFVLPGTEELNAPLDELK